MFSVDSAVIIVPLLEQRHMEARESMEFWLTASTLGLQTHPVVISPIPKDVVKTDIFGSWINASVPNL